MRIKVTAFALVIIAFASLTVTESEGGEAAQQFDSPRLSKLAKQMSDDEAANQVILDRFWQEMQQKAPLIEPISNDSQSYWVTFLWRGNSETNGVNVLGGPPTCGFTSKLMRFKNTDLWYRTDRLPSDARFVYRFMINLPDEIPTDIESQAKIWDAHRPQPDPLNSRSGGEIDGSLAELPDAPAQPWLERKPAIPTVVLQLLEKASGKNLGESTIKSEFLKQDRTFVVYTPPGYDPKGKPCGVLVMFDGNRCNQIKNNAFPIKVILDNLILEHKIAPLVALFVFQTENRERELGCSEPFADFVAKELVPQVRKDYNVSAEPTRTIIGGVSMGGLMASYCAYRHPEVFGKVLSMSGSYEWFPEEYDLSIPMNVEPGWLTRQIATAPHQAVEFYLSAGRFENSFPWSLLGENRRFRDVLQARGYSVRYSEFSGGHDPFGWRGEFGEGLIWLSNQQPKK